MCSNYGKMDNYYFSTLNNRHYILGFFLDFLAGAKKNLVVNSYYLHRKLNQNHNGSYCLQFSTWSVDVVPIPLLKDILLSDLQNPNWKISTTLPKNEYICSKYEAMWLMLDIISSFVQFYLFAIGSPYNKWLIINLTAIMNIWPCDCKLYINLVSTF